LEALLSNSTGGSNTALGNQALKWNTDSFGTAVGTFALKANTTGTGNTATGYIALYENTTGDNSTAVGREALRVSTTGGWNVAVGFEAGRNVTTGMRNTCLGYQALKELTTGSNNTGVGYEALRNGQPGGGQSTGSNKIGLGDNNITSFYCKVSLTATSDKRDKTDVEPVAVGLDFVNKLKPVTYKWDERIRYVPKQDRDNVDLDTIITDGTHKGDSVEIGFLAQDVEELENEYGHNIADKTNLITDLTDDGKQYSLKYERLVPILTKAIQELSAENKALMTRIQALENA